MIGRLNHVAIAVPDLDAAAAQYSNTLGADVGPPQEEPDHGVTVVFITLPNTKIELLYPLGADSPIQGFLDKNPAGGIHHVCYEVNDIMAARDKLAADGAGVLGSGEPKIGAHGKPVLFLHPKDFNGCLIEFGASLMSIMSAIVLYAMLWFLTLFIVLPLRTRTQGESGDVVPGTHSSAPENAQMAKTARITTYWATGAFVVIAGIIFSGVISMNIVESFIEVR